MEADGRNEIPFLAFANQAMKQYEQAMTAGLKMQGELAECSIRAFNGPDPAATFASPPHLLLGAAIVGGTREAPRGWPGYLQWVGRSPLRAAALPAALRTNVARRGLRALPLQAVAALCRGGYGVPDGALVPSNAGRPVGVIRGACTEIPFITRPGPTTCWAISPAARFWSSVPTNPLSCTVPL